MAYNTKLAERVRKHLKLFPNIKVEEKSIFGGLAFMINGKMCVNVSGENLMCRFDPLLTEELKERDGFLPMVMNGKKYKGYCYIEPTGYTDNRDFEYWVNLCLEFNERAKSSKK